MSDSRQTSVTSPTAGGLPDPGQAAAPLPTSSTQQARSAQSLWRHCLALSQQRLHAVLNALFPESCASCQNEELRAANLFCDACEATADRGYFLRQVAEIPAYATFSYSPAVQSALHRFKFQGHSELGRRFALALTPLVARLPNPQGLLLVAVPAHPLRVAERGYNQAALLVRSIANYTGMACAPRLLRRTAWRAQQSHLSRSERQRLSAAAFSVHGSSSGRSVVLVDDVLTTGSTATACIAALNAADIPVAAVLTVAQSGHDSERLHF